MTQGAAFATHETIASRHRTRERGGSSTRRNGRTPAPSRRLGGSFPKQAMELNGTLSNREVLFETSALARLKVRLLQELPPCIEVLAPPRQRSGLIK